MQPLSEQIRERLGGVDQIDFSFREVRFHCCRGDLTVSHLPDGYLYHRERVDFPDLLFLITDDQLTPNWEGPRILTVEADPSIQEKEGDPPYIPSSLLMRWLREIDYDLYPSYTRTSFSLREYLGITSRLMEVATYQSDGKTYRTYRDLLSDQLWDLPPRR